MLHYVPQPTFIMFYDELDSAVHTDINLVHFVNMFLNDV